MQQDNGHHFADGIYLNKVSDSAPEWIKADVSIHVEKAILWLQTLKATGMVNEKGYINLTGKESKGGKRYFEVNTWRPNKEADNAGLPQKVEYPAGPTDEPPF